MNNIATGPGFNPQDYAKKDGETISNVNASGSFTGNLNGSISGSSIQTNQALLNHENSTGSSVHGLGTMSTQNSNNVIITGGSVSVSTLAEGTFTVITDVTRSVS